MIEIDDAIRSNIAQLELYPPLSHTVNHSDRVIICTLLQRYDPHTMEGKERDPLLMGGGSAIRAVQAGCSR